VCTASDGFEVVIVGRRLDVLTDTAKAINDALGDVRVLAEPCDLEDPAAVGALADRLGPGPSIDVLVNNAGGVSLESWNPSGPYNRPPTASGEVAANKAGRQAISAVPKSRPRLDIALMNRTAMVSSSRPISGRADSSPVGAMPGWLRLLVIPQPPAVLRRSSSSANSPNAIFDWL